MRLKFLNEGYKEDELFDNSLSKYVRARGKGNINRKQATDNPDKTVHPDNADDIKQPDRSGNQHTTATTDKDANDLLGASGNSRDKQKASNLVGNPSTPL